MRLSRSCLEAWWMSSCNSVDMAARRRMAGQAAEVPQKVDGLHKVMVVCW